MKTKRAENTKYLVILVNHNIVAGRIEIAIRVLKQKCASLYSADRRMITFSRGKHLIMKLIKPLYLIIVSSLLLFGCELNYVDYIEHLESPDGKYNFCLYGDGIGVGDPGFRVLKVEKEVNPENVKINWSFRKGVSQQDTEWLLARELLANYEESSFYTSNPKLELIDNRFLVFSRGGYLFGLYDLTLEKDTINNCCPWGEWASQNVWAKNGDQHSGEIKKNEESDYGLWVEKNIHNKITEYIKLNK